MNWFVALMIRPLTIAVVAWLIVKILRVRHPASQHLLWSAALGGMLIIVPLTFVLPRFRVAVLPAKQTLQLHAVQSSASAAPVSPGAIELVSGARAPSVPARPNPFPNGGTLMALVYLAGVFAICTRQLVGRLLVRRLVERSRPLTGRLRESDDVIVPITVGLFSPVVVLPANWRQWSGYARRSVLRHEFAHIRRGDLLNSALAGFVRILLWFHPVVWYLSRKIATLSEMACDASAVEKSVSPTAYCRLLLQFTEQVAQSGHRARLPGLAMASTSSIDLRIERILATSNHRLQKLARPGLVLAFGIAPALCLAASLEIGESTAITVPLRMLMFLQGEHSGKLKPDLVANAETGQTEPMEPAAAQDRATLPILLAPEDRVFTGATFFRKNGRVKLALVEPKNGPPYLFADVNQNNLFEENERFLFEGSKREVVLKLPLPAGEYRYYPIRLFVPNTGLYMSDSSGNKDGGGRTLLRSPFAFVEGTVDIGGQRILVKYMFDGEKCSAYPDWGWQGMDTNGDGRIQEGANSDEWTFAKDESVIFHVNGRDVSTVSVDLKSGSFVVRQHPTGDNKRILLHSGERVPDFLFTDLDGKSHSFAEFHGKYVLLDFWGTWCGPCRRELPELEKVYRQFRPRGLVVLGMGDDRDSDKARKVLQAAGVTYPQSAGEVGNDLVYKRFRINRFPTKVLLSPEGKVIAGDADGSFDRERIASTLEKLLPAIPR